MNIIEQATRRLEQLESAGMIVPAPSRKPASDVDLVASRTVIAATSVTITPQPTSDDAGATAPALRLVSGEPNATPTHPAVVTDRSALAPRSSTTIDLDLLRNAGYLVPGVERSQIAEQFRHIKRDLMKNAGVKSAGLAPRGTLLMVTSALPGEGKTFCSINLAMSLAMEIDTSVILIDADVIRPSVFTRMGTQPHMPGLLDVLADSSIELADALVATNVPKLALMSSGAQTGRSTEWLASGAMEALLQRLAADYPDHIVIFDAPPLLLTSESATLAAKVAQVLVVVEASKTRRGAVEEAFRMLKHCPSVMSVLNKGDEPGGTQRYGYYYQ